MKDLVYNYLGNFWLKLFWLTAGFLNLALAAFLYFFIRADGLIATHYTIYGGVDYFAPALRRFQFSAIGLGFVLFNSFWGYKLWGRYKALSFFLNFMSVVISIVLVLVGLMLYLVNR